MTPAQFLTRAALRRLLTWRGVKQITAVICVVSITAAAYIYHTSRRPTPAPICGLVMHPDPFAVRVFEKVEKTGNFLHRFLTEPLPSDEVFAEYFFGTIDVFRWVALTITDPIRGSQHWLFGDGPVGVNPYTIAQPCTPPDQACQQDQGQSPSAPWDPKNAALTKTAPKVGASGIAAVTAAARKYWDSPSELRLAVAIAGAESEFQADPTDPPPGMRGAWQINENAHPHLFPGRDWRNLDDNAWMAYQVYKAAGRSFEPWSTYGGGGYTKYLDKAQKAIEAPPAPSGMTGQVPAPVDPPQTPAAPESCVPGAATVGLWNAYNKNSRASVTAGVQAMAASGTGAMCLNEASEWRSTVQAALPGWKLSKVHNAVPIAVDPTKFKVIREWWDRGLGVRRVEVGSGGGRTVGPKSINTMLLEPVGGGKRFSLACSHMIPTVDRKGDFDSKKPKRILAYLEHLNNWLAVANRQKKFGPVVVAGDMNTTFDPMRKWEHNGFKDVGAAGDGTHGGRRIDKIYTFGMPTPVVPEGSRFKSDHEQVVAAFPGMIAAPAATPGASPLASMNLTDPGGKRYNLGPVKPQAQKVADLIGHRFDLKVIGGYRANDPYPDHPSGRALDLMVYGDHAKGQAIAEFAKANAAALGVDYLIWDQHIWSTGRAGEGWRPMADRGNPTANHKDHIHLMVKP